jgi:hypothetical protein
VRVYYSDAPAVVLAYLGPLSCTQFV